MLLLVESGQQRRGYAARVVEAVRLVIRLANFTRRWGVLVGEVGREVDAPTGP